MKEIYRTGKPQPNELITYRCSGGDGNGNPLQCSCLENPMDSRAWWAAVYGVAKSRTQLSNSHTHTGVQQVWCSNDEIMTVVQQE